MARPDAASPQQATAPTVPDLELPRDLETPAASRREDEANGGLRTSRNRPP